MSAVEIALLRHGRTAWNREGRLQGRTDTPLAGAGRDELLGRRPPPPWDAARVLVSPLRRARETAALVAPNQPAEIEPLLIEMAFGDWEGARGAALAADPESGFRPVEAWGWAFRPPGGESPRDLRARLETLFARLAGAAGGVADFSGRSPRRASAQGAGDQAGREAGRQAARDAPARALLVAHMNVMRVALAWAHGWDFEGPAPFRIKRGRLYPLRRDAAGRPRPAGPPAPLSDAGPTPHPPSAPPSAPPSPPPGAPDDAGLKPPLPKG